MSSQILEVCVLVISISFTSVVAMGSLCMVYGLLMVLFGKDVD